MSSGEVAVLIVPIVLLSAALAAVVWMLVSPVAGGRQLDPHGAPPLMGRTGRSWRHQRSASWVTLVGGSALVATTAALLEFGDGLDIWAYVLMEAGVLIVCIAGAAFGAAAAHQRH